MCYITLFLHSNFIFFRQVEDDLVKVCKFSKKIAKRVAKAAGLSGKKAKDCFKVKQL